MTSRTRASSALVGTLALGLVGCAEDPRLRATMLVVSTESEWSAVADRGRLQGELGVSEDGCLNIEINGVATVVWAASGSSLSDDGTAFDLADVGTFELGEEVNLPGVVATTYRPIRENMPTAYRDCVTEDESGKFTAAFVQARPEDIE